MSRRLWLLAGLVCSTTALADAYDFRIYQLGNPQEGRTGFTSNANANFRAFARRMGALMTATNLAPPETLGHSAFSITAELSVVDLQGATAVNQMPTQRPITGPVLLPSLHVRKGLPWSFELGARAAWFEKSRMGTGTVELKWALNEGFTYLPDIGVRAHVTKLLNSRDFDVTAGGIDLGLGKQFAIAGMVTLTPYVGWNLVFVGASSGSIDFNPGRSLADADRPDAQFADYYVYDNVQAATNAINRFYGGFRFIGGVVQLGFEFSYTTLGSFNDARIGTVDATCSPDRPVCMPAVIAYNSTVGFDF